MKVAIYARVSTSDKGQDNENQLLALREHCERQGWTITHEYIDEASGKNARRPQFQAMMDDARHKRFNLLLFWALDRFSREGVLDTLQHLQRLTEAGCNWKSYTEQYLDSTGIFKDAVIAILAAVAKQERIRLSERTKAGMARAALAGRKAGRPRRMIPEVQLRARLLRAAGKTLSEISQEIGMSITAVSRAVGDYPKEPLKDQGGSK